MPTILTNISGIPNSCENNSPFGFMQHYDTCVRYGYYKYGAIVEDNAGWINTTTTWETFVEDAKDAGVLQMMNV